MATVDPSKFPGPARRHEILTLSLYQDFYGLESTTQPARQVGLLI